MHHERIYGLIDPRTHELKYIGRTRQPLNMRLNSHYHDARRHPMPNPRHQWLRELDAAGLRPDVFEIERVSAIERTEAERFWIAYFRSIGAHLLNVIPPHEGGDRSHIITWTPELDARLGKEPDAWIAEQLGVTRKAVTYRRNVLGIAASYDRTRNVPPPPAGGWNKKTLPEHIIAQLGKRPDYVLAAEAGVTKPVIRRVRMAHGIASYAAQTGATGRFQEGMPHPRWSRLPPRS